MFTGLVADIGTVRHAKRASDRVVFTIETGSIDCSGLELGESIAINGVCLTVTESSEADFSVLAGAETLKRTNLGGVRPGAKVNLEQALRAGDRLGGHFVQGHVDGVGTIAARRDRGANLEIDIRAPMELARYCVDKGSIAIDGISLTLNKVAGQMLSIALIPHTVSETTLGDRRVGDSVNLEIDMIAKYVEKLFPWEPIMTGKDERTTRVLAALDAIRRGEMVILVDDEDRENEGDLCMAAEKVTPEAVNFMAKHGRGLICLTLLDQQIEKLGLPMMVTDNQAALGTAFTVSIEARNGVTTGISARDRATTILAAVADGARPDDVVSPGHVFPLKARSGGVLVRTGQTEGSVDLARLAGLKSAGVICEIMRDDGEMARMPELEAFAEEHGLILLSVADLIAYRLSQERIVVLRHRVPFRPPVVGDGEAFVASLYTTDVEETEYLALVRGDVAGASAKGESVLVRVHTMCPIADPFRIRPELEASLRTIDDAGLGVVLCVHNSARTSLVSAFERQVLRMRPTGGSGGQSEALRDFGLGAQVLAELGLKKIRLLTNSDRKIVGIEGFGIEMVSREPIGEVPSTPLATIDGQAGEANGK